MALTQEQEDCLDEMATNAGTTKAALKDALLGADADAYMDNKMNQWFVALPLATKMTIYDANNP